MVQLQTVFGFFDNVAEAQQAVQLLLAGGVTSDTVHLSTQPDPSPTGSAAFSEPADRRSGRFFSSLFGNREELQSEPVGSGVKANRRPGSGGEPLNWPGSSRITVRTQSADEARLVSALLKQAGAGAVTRRKYDEPRT